jgi:hypothetical protein
VARTEKVTLSNKNENLARKESKATPIPTITEIIIVMAIIRKEKINPKGGLELAQSRIQKNSNQPIRTQRLFSFNVTNLAAKFKSFMDPLGAVDTNAICVRKNK